MNLHEYQAKALLANYGCPVPESEVVRSGDEAVVAYDKLGLSKAVVKAQVHAGGRGKAGGVRITDDKAGMVEAVKSMLGTNLVTYQTDAKGQPVHQVLIETPSLIERELYLGALVDRVQQKVVFMASSEGGVDIEKVAEETPEKITQVAVDPLVGLQPFQCRQMAFDLALHGHQMKAFGKLMMNLARMFVELDLSMLEINPLIVTKAGDLVCLDAKINLDDNALYRQPKLRELRDETQEDERERRAQTHELNYIALDGNIGCMVNGAGLAMATMDLIQLHGGSPANFLDVGGGATQERVAEAFKIILSDTRVKAVLVNIFGGIVRCDLIADGIIAAVAQVGITIPVIVRLEGNRAEQGLEKLNSSGLNIEAAASFDEAAQASVQAVK